MKKSGSDPELHVTVRVGPDPRFVFQFDGEPECSPQVFLVKGNDKQAVFTSKFRFRNPGDRNLSRSVIFNLSLFSYTFSLDRFFLVQISLEDGAAHVALAAAAVDLSMYACRLFSHKIRKERRQPSSIGVV